MLHHRQKIVGLRGGDRVIRYPTVTMTFPHNKADSGVVPLRKHKVRRMIKLLQFTNNKSNHLRINLNIQPGTSLICLLIIGVWLISALNHNLSIFATQKSSLLLGFGAINGTSLQRGEYWKLISSQFLHVKFTHMLLNVTFIYYIGTKIEKFFGFIMFIAIYLIAGTLGQLASVLSYPHFVSSGASQALCGIIGAFLVLFLYPLRVSKITIIWVGIFLIIQTFLDLFFAGYIKAGHWVGFIIGLLLGLFIRKIKLFKSINNAALF
jgi:rhomboid protease GluP